MTDFAELVKARRSANKFIPGIPISRHDLEQIFSLVKFAPSAFNLQHSHYIVVNESQEKDAIFEASGKQYKVKSASAVIVVLGSTEAYRDVAEINQGLLHLGVLSKQEFDSTVNDVTSFYEQRGAQFRREEAIRNASISAMLFMLCAKQLGWDTCPMIGFDPDAVSSVVQAPDHLVPVMLIAIGKEDEPGKRARGYRKPVDEFVSFVGF